MKKKKKKKKGLFSNFCPVARWNNQSFVILIFIHRFCNFTIYKRDFFYDGSIAKT